MLNKTIKIAATALTLSLVSLVSHAHDWVLDTADSSISFVSTKKDNIAETHLFTDFNGNISNDKATVTIMPDSVESGIGIRNERMREFLFETGVFPKITITADTGVLNGLQANVPVKTTIPATLSLHGVEKEISMDVMLLKTANASVTITSQKPVIIKAEDYNLNEGILKLSNLVGDIPITKAVPTYFSLVFNHL